MRSTGRREPKAIKPEPGYIVEKVKDGEWIIRKIDVSDPARSLGEHRVVFGRCDCQGFSRSQDLRCRHTDMVLTNPTVVDRKTARKAAAEILFVWDGAFDGLIFNEYIEAGAGEGDAFAAPGEGEGIKAVRLRARGKPLVMGGKEYRRVFCVRRRMQVIVDIS